MSDDRARNRQNHLRGRTRSRNIDIFYVGPVSRARIARVKGESAIANRNGQTHPISSEVCACNRPRDRD